jgi:hypothetical protein
MFDKFPASRSPSHGFSNVRISSPSTPIAKFVWPIGWLGMMGYLSVLAFTNSPGLRWGGGGPAPVWGKALLIVLVGVGVVVAYRVSLPLKRVHLAEGGIRASNYVTEAFIPWSGIRRVVVHGSFGARRGPLVELDLRARGAFGRRISLLPASPEALARLRESIPGELQIPWEHRPP